MATINPYLNFNGNTEEVFNFYKSVFGGDFITLMRFKDGPNMPAGEENKIMHIALPIGKTTTLMASDVPASYPAATMGNNFHISVDTDTEAEAFKIFNDLSAGGKVTMPIEKSFWGSLFGMFTDKYGIQWMVSHNGNQQ